MNGAWTKAVAAMAAAMAFEVSAVADTFARPRVSRGRRCSSGAGTGETVQRAGRLSTAERGEGRTRKLPCKSSPA